VEEKRFRHKNDTQNDTCEWAVLRIVGRQKTSADQWFKLTGRQVLVEVAGVEPASEGV